ncbi:hypothetical protein C4J81_17235 [Deltaproteobacteria bacterium Smac51]|nr:hypothetical protein C4J81_17235 [Deltaproteobacteria bacterium Smac51]
MTRINQDLTDVSAGLGFDPVPAGEYQAHITDSDIANTKNGDLMLKLSWTILEGPHASRMLFDRIMLSGSDNAVDFGKRKLKTIADATGHHNPNRIEDSEELHGRPCSIKVTIDTYESNERNEIKDYKSLSAPTSFAPAARASTPPQSTPPPPAQGAHASPPPPRRTPPPPANHPQSSPLSTSPTQGTWGDTIDHIGGAVSRPQSPFEPTPTAEDAPF